MSFLESVRRPIAAGDHVIIYQVGLPSAADGEPPAAVR